MMDAPALKTEYAIYLFDHPGPQQKSECRWRRHATLFDEASALLEAKTLYLSEKYVRIEVKKRFYDPALKRTVDAPLKVFRKRSLQDSINRIAAFLGLAA